MKLNSYYYDADKNNQFWTQYIIIEDFYISFDEYIELIENSSIKEYFPKLEPILYDLIEAFA